MDRRDFHGLKSTFPVEARPNSQANSAATTWLELHYLRSTDADTRNRSVTQGSLMLKRLESAQRRHHNAMKELTQLRRLLPDRNALPQLRVFPYKQERA